MCCGVLQCVLLQYVVAIGRSVFQRVAVCVAAVCCCSRSQDVVIESGLMEKLQLEQFCLAACCSVLQRAAVCCSVLQRVAACCSVLQRVAVCSKIYVNPTLNGFWLTSLMRCVLHCVALCCSVLQYVAVCCNVF